MTGFVQRKIKISVQLAPNTGTNQPNTFTGTGSDTVTIENLRDDRSRLELRGGRG
jgi:hypothetical protein